MTEIEKLTAGHPDTQSADIVAGNIEALRALFPEAMTEGKIDFEVLKQCLGGAVDEREERYGLNWHGKRRARQIALTPSTGTLLPCPEDSVDWDTTQNLMIEGDNLEVLKLLQKSYAGKVKLIYIDPPYNTGKDFVYPDDFRDSISHYLTMTGQIEGGRRTTTNSEASGRFHTDWLNMMYPRLKLARTLLRDDGALFMSIDDGEVDNLKKLGAEIFGEECFVGILSILVNPRGRHLDKFIAQTHDNIVAFVKDPDVAGSIFGSSKEGAMLEDYNKEDRKGKYRELGLRNRNQAFNPITRPNLYYPLFVEPSTGSVSLSRDSAFTEEVLPITADGVKTCWTWGREKVVAEKEMLTASRASDGTWRIFRKDYLNGDDGETASTLAKSVWLDKEFNNDYGRKALKELLGAPVLDFPKSPSLIQKVISIASSRDDIVMDFFAGSGTTAHSTMLQNAKDGASRKFILVQLPEPLSATEQAQRTAVEFCDSIGVPRTIAEITKERVRRAAQKLKQSEPTFAGDTGFRVFKLARSNVLAWEPETSDLQDTLLKHVEHLVPGRTEADILTELLLKLGLDLCVPIETKDIAGKSVHSVGAGALIVCLAEGNTRETVEGLAQGIIAWWQALAPAGDTRVVFKDSAFADDVAKTNMAAILNQAGIKDMRSL